jgi:hypothetical protein
MDTKLREQIEIAETDAVQALSELRLFKVANWASAMDHVQRVVVRLDEALEQIQSLITATEGRQ